MSVPAIPALSDDAQLQHRPSVRDLRVFHAALAPWRALSPPHCYGLGNIPVEGPVLLVGNHTIFGVLDMPLMLDEINRARDRFVRGMADNAHLAVPGWRDLLLRAGAVRGTRDNCRTLLAAGEAVLTYPGGGREVAKRRGEKYRLLWKDRTGFARMAIEAGTSIVPFGAVGAEECFDIVLDADHPVFAPIRTLAQHLGANWDLVWPLVRGIGPTPLPRPQPLYFGFGAPISTEWCSGQTSEPALHAVRDEVRQGVEEQLKLMQAERARHRPIRMARLGGTEPALVAEPRRRPQPR